MEKTVTYYWPGGWLELLSSLCAFSGVITSLLIVIFSTNYFFIVTAIFDMLVSVGIILANYWKKPSWYLPFFVFNGLNIVILSLAAVTAFFVAFLCLAESQKVFCDYLNLLAGNAGENLLSLLYHLRGSVEANSFVQTLCWLVVLSVGLLFRVLSHAITYHSCILLKEEKKQLRRHSLDVEIKV